MGLLWRWTCGAGWERKRDQFVRTVQNVDHTRSKCLLPHIPHGTAPPTTSSGGASDGAIPAAFGGGAANTPATSSTAPSDPTAGLFDTKPKLNWELDSNWESALGLPDLDEHGIVDDRSRRRVYEFVRRQRLEFEKAFSLKKEQEGKILHDKHGKDRADARRKDFFSLWAHLSLIFATAFVAWLLVCGIGERATLLGLEPVGTLEPKITAGAASR